MKLRAIGSTVIAVAVTVLLLAQRQAGFMLFFFAFPLIPWFLYSVYVIARPPACRSVQATKVALWVVGVSAVLGIHYRLHLNTKARATEVVSAIRQYASERGTYPPNLEAVGLSSTQLTSKLGRSSAYGIESGNPHFFYASTYIPFSTESYDFQNNVWKHAWD
jgi:hypothetical protein